MSTEDKAVRLGHPSYVWRFGQERRLNLIRKHVPLEGKRILDVGCGLGVYVRRLRGFSDAVCGVDVDEERITEGSQDLPSLQVAPAEHLPFPDGSFDVVLLNEVLEHVQDDRQAILETYRVLAPEGRMVLFVPNRLYPFETHGFYAGKRYIFGNIPLINYLPDRIRDRFCPHVRAYTRRGLTNLFNDLSGRFVVNTTIYPGYDHISVRRPTLGRLLRTATYNLERSPLCRLGLSHFVVFEKYASAPHVPARTGK